MKINKSRLARGRVVERSTVDNYLNGFIPKKIKEKACILDDYYEGDCCIAVGGVEDILLTNRYAL